MKFRFLFLSIAYFGAAECWAIWAGREANRRMTDPAAHGIAPAAAADLHQFMSHLTTYAIAIPAYAALVLIRYGVRKIKNRKLSMAGSVEIPSESGQTLP